MVEPLQITTLFGLGFVLGLKHALDGDHIVAISAIVSQTKNLQKSSLVGAIWGAGHTVALFLVGLTIMVFKWTIPIAFALFFEFTVGIMLVVLGADVLRKIRKEKIHWHTHQHNGNAHIHIHPHQKSLSHNHIHKSFVVGMIHGLAGSAMLMLLVLTTANSVFAGLLFILIFGIGSTAGMLGVSGIIALPFLLSGKFVKITNTVKISAGVASIVFGFSIIYEVGLLIV